ncbi:MAG: enoyl-CoA hydratase/isomerase family protein [Rhizobiales bacterium]|nr:enoyl-CoA hydratase/isomerase family protein [Hyphomicrobiales bacterium]
MTDDVIIGRTGACGVITLNRPKALHALTLDMCREIIAALQAWERDSAVAAVIIDHSGERGFCAGGDIRLLYESLRRGGDVRGFFHTEYRMNHLLFAYGKPAVCFMNGVVMGGGAGIAMPCRYRVATEETKFAMPETGIGLFPDVGGGWFLSRLPGRMGEWLALTGARLNGADCLAVGLASHYVPRGRLAEVKTRICEEPEAIETILRGASVTPPPVRRDDIDRLFSASRIKDIIAALKADSSAWAAEQLAEMEKKSPRSCKVALRQLGEGRRLKNFSDNMRMEYRIVSRLLGKGDFAEGVRAFVIDKDNRPRWDPPRFEDINDEEIDAIFAPLPDDQEWTPLGRD